MDPELQALIDRIAELSNDELLDLDERLRAEVTKAGDADLSEENIALLTTLADGVELVRVEVTAREDKADELAAKREELMGRVNGEQEEAETPAETPETPETPGEGDEAEVTPEGAPVVPETPQTPTAEAEEAVAASAPIPISRPPLARVAARRPASRAPRSEDSENVVITAAAEIPHISAGSRLRSWREVGDAFSQRLSALGKGAGDTTKAYVARFSTQAPNDRILGKDEERNARLIDDQQAIVAAGGNCAPVAARYDLEVVSVDDRPVRDSLVQFQADRGGIRFIRPPVLADVDAGVLVRTEAQDTANSPLKPCVTVTCGSPVEVDVSSVSKCIRIGNYSRRFFGEQFEAWWKLAGAQHAREAEINLLTRMGTLSTAVTTGQFLGAARDWLENLHQAGAQYRSRHRMRRDALLEVVAPAWLYSMLVADLVRQMPGDQTLGAAAAKIAGAISEANVRVTWALDGETGQIYGAEGGGHLNAWNGSVIWYMYHPGAFLFLDGGTLDLGIDIRDFTTLIPANDVAAFAETFEEVAFVGQEALRITSTLCPSGAAAALEDTSAICASGS